MLAPKAPIFREKAVKQYMQGRDKDTLPRFISLPTALLLWMLCGLLLAVGGIAWTEEVPLYTTGQGIILADQNQLQPGSSTTMALVFLPAEQTAAFHRGQPVQITLGGSGPQINSTITEIAPGVISPYRACKQYRLENNCALLVARPSILAKVQLRTLSALTYAGSTFTAKVQVGSQRIISLLIGMGGSVRK
ncbi:MAG: hypothetical protein E6J34_01990 [Chloroflexi bacterium]|nr:MAG: hypothetical protein E6J34_01990 [Chloroflexota bacterium]